MVQGLFQKIKSTGAEAFSENKMDGGRDFLRKKDDGAETFPENEMDGAGTFSD